MAADRVADRGWDNVVLVQAPVEEAVLPAVADHALFCATHDVLQSEAALDNVLAHVRDGGTVAATGGKWGPPWAVALNAGVLALHAPFVRDFAGFDRPWGRLQPRVARAAGAGGRDGRGLPGVGHGAAAGRAPRGRAAGAGTDGRPRAPVDRHPRLTRRLRPRRRPAAAVSAARIAAVGPGRPVISSTCSTAWCSSTSRPPATRQPAALAAAARAVGHGA